MDVSKIHPLQATRRGRQPGIDKGMESVLWQNNQLSGKLLKAMGSGVAFSIAESRFPRSVSKEGRLKRLAGKCDEDERREREPERGRGKGGKVNE